MCSSHGERESSCSMQMPGIPVNMFPLALAIVNVVPTQYEDGQSTEQVYLYSNK